MRAEIYWIPYTAPGQIAVMQKPPGFQWLEEEMHELKSQGVDILVSALEPFESEVLGLSEEKLKAEAACMEFYNYPIVDHDIPDEFPSILKLIATLSRKSKEGQNVVFHCRKGIGRSPLLAASLMVYQGMSTRRAFQLIRKARQFPVPDVPDQYRFVQQIERMYSDRNPYENPIEYIRDWASEKLGRSI
ncbi:MAG: dual specificity protein phosphatase family protein [Bacteroidota bacterium]